MTETPKYNFNTKRIKWDIMTLICHEKIMDDDTYSKQSWQEYLDYEKLNEFRNLDIETKFEVVNKALKEYMIIKLKPLNISYDILQGYNFLELCELMNQYSDNSEDIFQIIHYLLDIIADLQNMISINIWLAEKYKNIKFRVATYEIYAPPKAETIDILKFVLENLYTLDFIEHKDKRRIITAK